MAIPLETSTSLSRSPSPEPITPQQGEKKTYNPETVVEMTITTVANITSKILEASIKRLIFFSPPIQFTGYPINAKLVEKLYTQDRKVISLFESIFLTVVLEINENELLEIPKEVTAKMKTLEKTNFIANFVIPEVLSLAYTLREEQPGAIKDVIKNLRRSLPCKNTLIFPSLNKN